MFYLLTTLEHFIQNIPQILSKFAASSGIEL